MQMTGDPSLFSSSIAKSPLLLTYEIMQCGKIFRRLSDNRTVFVLP
jgi:hypothetical protein